MKMFIDGRWTDSSDGAVSSVINPATGVCVDTVPEATEQDVDRAIALAVEGQKEWNDIPLHVKTFHFRALLCPADGKYWKKSRPSCVKKAVSPLNSAARKLPPTLRSFAFIVLPHIPFYGKSLPYNAEPRSQGDVAFTIHEPLGVFANIVPFNYPVELAAHKLAPMLVTGNSVVLMPSSKTPRSALLLVELLVRAGVPAKAVCCITGAGSKVGSRAAADPRRSRRQLYRQYPCGHQPSRNLCQKPSSSVSGAWRQRCTGHFFDDCDYALALDEVINGRIGNAGQTCCASKRFIVQRGIYDRFVRDLTARLAKIKMGDPSDPSVELGPCVREDSAADVEKQIRLTIEQGGKIGVRRQAHQCICRTHRVGGLARNRHRTGYGGVRPCISNDRV